MPKRSLWESLGRAVHFGLEKAKEMGTHLADQAEGRLEAREAERQLAESERELGRFVVARVSAGEVVADEELDRLVARVRECERILAEAEERARREKEREEAEAERRAQADDPGDPEGENASDASSSPFTDEESDRTQSS